MDTKYYTPDEVAESLKINVRTVYNLIASGELAALKVGNQYRITQTAIDALAKNGGTHE